MVKTTMKFVEEVKELKTLIIAKTFDPEMLKGMDGETFELMKRMMGLFDSFIDILVKSAETTESMDKKLDLLLKEKES